MSVLSKHHNEQPQQMNYQYNLVLWVHARGTEVRQYGRWENY